MLASGVCRIVGALLGVAFFYAPASAALDAYTDRAAFLAALPGASQGESFEDEAIDVQTGSRTISVSTSEIAFIGDSGATFGVNNVVVGGRGPTDGDQYLQVGFIGVSSVRFQFDVPLLAFGIDVVDKNVNDLDGLIDDISVDSAVNPGGEGEGQFWGVIASADMAFTNIGFGGLGPSVPGDAFALDNIAYVALPEPSSLILLGVGGATACGLRIRRRAK